MQNVNVDPARAQRRRMGLTVVVTSAVGLIAAAIVAYLTIDRWLSPTEALTWMAVGMIPPTLIVALLLSWPSGQKLSLRLALSGLAPAVISCVGGLVVISSWAVPGTRVRFVGFAADEPMVADAMLRDTSEDVAVRACQVVARRFEDPRWHVALSAVLTIRPEVATRCLGDADARIQQAFAPTLADRWSRQLAAAGDDVDADLMCQIAASMPSLPLSTPELDARLLYCILDAPNETAQQCCATSLAATVSGPEQWVEHIEETVGMVRDDDVVTGVFAMAFTEDGLSAPQLEFAKTVGFHGPTAQRVALEFACDSIVNGNTAIVDHLAAALEGQCEVDVASIARGRAVWANICSVSLTKLGAKPEDVGATLCTATRETLVTNAVVTASDLVKIATEKDVQSRMSKNIDAGYRRMLEHLGSPEGIIEGAPSWVPKVDVERARGTVRFY